MGVVTWARARARAEGKVVRFVNQEGKVVEEV